MDADPIRGLLILFLPLALMIPATVSQSDMAKPHGPGVIDAWHSPVEPRRGEPVTVAIQAADPANLTAVTLVYCRAENYACAPSVNMTRDDAGFSATIRWHAGFFQGVENVGYNFTLKHGAGHETTSPTDYWPYRPNSLPPEAGIYYFYRLEPAAEQAPAPTPILFAIAMLLMLEWRRRT